MNTKHTPNAGDEVYDIHGRAASYIALTGGGHVVEPIYEDEDSGEPSFGRPETWNQVFTAPPTQKLHAEVAEIQQKIAEAQQQLHAVREQRRLEDAEYAARAGLRKQFAQLQQLDDFIAGKITHFVVLDDYNRAVQIQEFGSFIKANEDRYERKLRLVSLYGASNGDLSWHIDRYSDGSGSNGRSGYCWPATSYEDALTKAQAWLDKAYAKWKGGTGYERNYSLAYVECAKRLGLSVPDDMVQHASELAAAATERAIESARQEVEKAKARLDAELAKATGASHVHDQ